MTPKNEAPAFTPLPMNKALADSLNEAGFILPDSWPFPARCVAGMSQAEGWSLRQPGSLNRDHPNFGVESPPQYIAPDGTPFIRATGNARVALVAVSRRTGPLPLRVLPGHRRPKWMIADLPKGEIPEALRRWLLKPGEKLAKGEKRVAREAEAFAVEPAQAEAVNNKVGKGRYGCGARGIAAAVIGPRPRGKAGTEELRAWERAFRKLQRERPEMFAKGGE